VWFVQVVEISTVCTSWRARRRTSDELRERADSNVSGPGLDTRHPRNLGGVVTSALTRVAKRVSRRGPRLPPSRGALTIRVQKFTGSGAGRWLTRSTNAVRSGDCKFTTIRAKDGTKLAAEVHRPRTRPVQGVAIFVHGFCGDKGENGLFHALAAHCVDEGFAAVLYDWRGIADSKGDFPSSTLRDHTADFASVVRWTKSQFEESTGLLHAVGFSLGAAVVGLAIRSGLPLTSIAYLSPASRPRQSMWPRYDSERLWTELGRRGGVIEKPGTNVLLGTSILQSLRDTDLGVRAFDMRTPLLVCHGTDDLRIDCAHSRQLAEQRSSRSKFRYVEFKGASHSFRPAETSWDRLGRELTSWFDNASQLDGPKTAVKETV